MMEYTLILTTITLLTLTLQTNVNARRDSLNIAQFLGQLGQPPAQDISQRRNNKLKKGYEGQGHLDDVRGQGQGHVSSSKEDIHGGVPMGVPNNGCDNAKWRLWVDWDNSTTYPYTCQNYEYRIPVRKTPPKISCLREDEIPLPLHKCMTTTIRYADKPPRGGSHRPLWPVYGEYMYAPPQRWVHSLEHGAAVFLYHPCADQSEVDALKEVARSCIRRHVITPYRDLPPRQPLAVVTWGCKITFSHVVPDVIRQFVRAKALQTEESHVTRDGQYDLGLVRRAPLVTDINDIPLCPKPSLPTAETMDWNDAGKQS